MNKYWKGNCLTKEQKAKICYPYSDNKEFVFLEETISEAADTLFEDNKEVITDFIQKDYELYMKDKD